MPILPATDHDDSQERSRRQILYYSRIGPGQRTMTGRIETEFGVRTRIPHRTEQRRTPITAGCVRRIGHAVRLLSLSVGRVPDAFGKVALVNSGEGEHSRDGSRLCSEHANQ